MKSTKMEISAKGRSQNMFHFGSLVKEFITVIGVRREVYNTDKLGSRVTFFQALYWAIFLSGCLSLYTFF